MDCGLDPPKAPKSVLSVSPVVVPGAGVATVRLGSGAGGLVSGGWLVFWVAGGVVV